MRFYTLPPRLTPWPYLLFNPNNIKEMNRRKWNHCILDSGIEMFLDPSIKDYSPSFLHRWKGLSRIKTDIHGEKIWITIPDYCDDLVPGSLGDNVKRTLDNIENFITVDDVNWLVVLQARYLNTLSFLESIQGVKDLLGQYPRIAIGTVCKCRKLSFIEKCAKLARAHFPNSWIHMFGLPLNALPRVKEHVDSFDSLAYTFTRRRSEGCATTHDQKRRYFKEYVERMKELLGES